MTTQKEKLLRAKVALSLYNVLDRQPTPEEVEQYTVTAQVLWKVVAGTKSMRSEMKRRKQLAIF